MLDIIYLILIFIVGSISIQISNGIFIMPYLLYLTNLKTEKSIILAAVMGVIYSLQTERIVEILFFFALFYIIFYQILKHLEYTYINVVIFSVAEQILWALVFEKGLDYIGIFVPFVFYNLFNLLFMKLYKKTKAGAVKQ
ncbi:hypothetical protein I6E17_06090 [Fusobacterium perfoetens]|uniref:hypothetical protein n=1 Tax=Fusobacterium perfoetens TaxID=852 RepID=UPI001F4715EA|nr:hypothetical protein [Fusobacterium perfoetens]MCF2625748.1 hypothetical protein [Fusobacterium perfoetens]